VATLRQNHSLSIIEGFEVARHWVSFLLIAGIFLSGCNSLQLDTVATGTVRAPDGRIAAGFQGNLCVDIVFKQRPTLTVCKELVTDSRGTYEIPIDTSASSFEDGDLVVSKVELYLQFESERQVIRLLDPAKIQPYARVTFNFVNRFGYGWGIGESVRTERDLARGQAGIPGALQYSIIGYVALLETKLNPLEVAFLTHEVSDSFAKDHLVYPYAKELLADGKLDMAGIRILASAAGSDSTRAKLKKLSTDSRLKH
jgi:hypothetical protein